MADMELLAILLAILALGAVGSMFLRRKKRAVFTTAPVLQDPGEASRNIPVKRSTSP